MYDLSLEGMIRTSIKKIHLELDTYCPKMAEHIRPWMEKLAGGMPEKYFLAPIAYPMMLLPWWLEESLGKDHQIQAQLCEASINGYYYIRLVDNIMDEQQDIPLLPGANYFHSNFQLPYQKLFAHDHPFWEQYRKYWYFSGEASLLDGRLTDIDLETFKKIAAQKVCAVKIPLAATCLYHECPETLADWYGFVDLFGCWHQMNNDLFDWLKDSKQGTVTYFLCEAKRRGCEQQDLAKWVIDGGFALGCQWLEEWMHQLKIKASKLNSPSLCSYLEERTELFEKRKMDVIQGFQAMETLMKAMGKSS